MCRHSSWKSRPRMWMLLPCFISEGVLKLRVPHWRGRCDWHEGEEGKAELCPLPSANVLWDFSWREVKTGTASSCTSAPSYADSGLGCVPASAPPPQMSGVVHLWLVRAAEAGNSHTCYAILRGFCKHHLAVQCSWYSLWVLICHQSPPAYQHCSPAESLLTVLQSSISLIVIL